MNTAGTKRINDPEVRRRQILEEAMKLFYEKGYDNTFGFYNQFIMKTIFVLRRNQHACKHNKTILNNHAFSFNYHCNTSSSAFLADLMPY